MNGLRLIRDGAHDGAFNMRADEFLFRSQIERGGTDSALRFYRFSAPAVTVGYGLWRSFPPPPPHCRRIRPLADNLPHSQDMGEGFVESPPPRFLSGGGREGVGRFIRRPTGGGIVEHGEDLVYSLIAPAGPDSPLRKVRESYFRIHEALRRALETFGVESELFEGRGAIHGAREVCVGRSSDGRDKSRPYACFSSPVPFDLMLGGRKIAGGAQKRSRGWLLHQGSIAWEALTGSYPDLSEKDFSECFAEHIVRLIEEGDRSSLKTCPLLHA